jgi:hypothetical protein
MNGLPFTEGEPNFIQKALLVALALLHTRGLHGQIGEGHCRQLELTPGRAARDQQQVLAGG